MQRIRTLWRSQKGEGYFSFGISLVLIMLVVAFAVSVFPVYIQKQQLDHYASELCRTAEISGRVAAETGDRAAELSEETGLTPQISWSSTGNIQLGDDISVTLEHTADIGFGGFGSIPVTLTSKASGKSEVYWK